MEKRYQIFISSTYKDLINERQKVTQAILKLYHFPIGMEMFHADNEEQWTQIKNTIDMSDYYILIMGRYCGTLIENEGISYTEKEYNYALSRNIPVLSFVISEDAKKEAYGVETSKQQRAYKKFKKKVLKLPCDFWMNSDELALLVTTALSMKFKERNRDGWIRNDKSGFLTPNRIDSFLVGNYDVFYYTVLKSREKKLVSSKLIIDSSGKVAFYNNIKEGSNKPEYTYHGICIAEENVIYVYLKNDFSKEQAVMSLIRSVGNLQRFLGLFTALSSNTIPVCIKLACFDEHFCKDRLDLDLLYKILCSANTNWDNDVLIFEEEQKYLFFSEEIIR